MYQALFCTPFIRQSLFAKTLTLVHVFLTTLYRVRKLKIKINLIQLVAFMLFLFLSHKTHLSKSHILRELITDKINTSEPPWLRKQGCGKLSLLPLSAHSPSSLEISRSRVLGWDSILQQSAGMQGAPRELVRAVVLKHTELNMESGSLY